MVRTSRPGTFREEELARYREAWSQPGALRSMVHWYRAAIRHPAFGSLRPVEPQALVLWGLDDHFLGPELAAKSLACCRDGRLETFETATHWLHHEEPDRVNRRLIEFLGG
jgi:pimeloyl-ACP methyl ester carboxylesterase